MTHSILYVNPLPEIPLIGIIESDQIFHAIDADFVDFRQDFSHKIIELFDRYRFDEMWCIVGPGAFTRMRIVTLTLNALAYARQNIILKSAHFFDLIPDMYTPILQINATEYLIREEKSQTIFCKKDLPKMHFMGYTKNNEFTEVGNFVQYSEDWDFLKKYFLKKTPDTLLAPIYIKSPNITCPTK